MYLSRVIGNAAIDLYHSRKREKEKRLPLDESMCLTALESDPHQSMEQKETSLRRNRMLQLIQEGLSSLPVKEYQALQMTMLSPGTSIRYAGAHNGIPYSTLRSRTLKGLRTLRRFLRQRRRCAVE
jgi:DNA-directed RNA polymerase specialized sigma24 family protein